jgi:hypothetical protein
MKRIRLVKPAKVEWNGEINMKKLQWVTNASLNDGVRAYNNRIKLEIECVRYYPMPSETVSVEELEATGTYGLYRKIETPDDSHAESPCPHCAFSHYEDEPCPKWEPVTTGITYSGLRYETEQIKPLAPLFANERKRIYDLETEINRLRRIGAPEEEIQAKEKEMEEIINGPECSL